MHSRLHNVCLQNLETTTTCSVSVSLTITVFGLPKILETAMTHPVRDCNINRTWWSVYSRGKSDYIPAIARRVAGSAVKLKRLGILERVNLKRMGQAQRWTLSLTSDGWVVCCHSASPFSLCPSRTAILVPCVSMPCVRLCRSTQLKAATFQWNCIFPF